MALGDWLAPAAAGIGGIASAWGASQANEANKKMSREQMSFQKDMSSTAWQRAVGDMKKAGINPMLAVSQGGASSPSGSQSTSQNVVPSNIAHSAMSAMSKKLEMDNLKSTNDQIRSQTILNQNSAQKVLADTRKSVADAIISEAEASALGIGLRFGSKAVSAISGAKGIAGSMSKSKAVSYAKSRLSDYMFKRRGGQIRYID